MEEEREGKRKDINMEKDEKEIIIISLKSLLHQILIEQIVKYHLLIPTEISKISIDLIIFLKRK